MLPQITGDLSAPRDLLEAARRVSRPTLFRSRFVEPLEFPTLDAAAEHVRALLGGAPPSFRIGRAAYPGYDDFPILTVRAGDEPVAYLADRWRDEEDVRAGQRIVEALFQRVGA